MNDPIQNKLFALKDPEYKAFQCRLMPTVDPDTVIGVRTPVLRKLARELLRAGGAEVFLACLPHTYYEENNLHAFLIAEIKDPNECVAALDTFLPYVDNWATCDSMRPKCFVKAPDVLLSAIERWLSDPHPYAVRFGIEMLMVCFLGDRFDEAYLARVAEIRSNEYYVNMMVAWYFAEALARQYSSALPYLTEHRLSVWVHNKTIRKAMESDKIRYGHKAYLKTLRRT